ncbi:unnamed protein product, partial [Urochloa humidicola]
HKHAQPVSLIGKDKTPAPPRPYRQRLRQDLLIVLAPLLAVLAHYTSSAWPTTPPRPYPLPGFQHRPSPSFILIPNFFLMQTRIQA